MRAPDVAFIREERRSEIPARGYCEFGPDLAVEILSPDDRARSLQRKIAQYLAAGTKIVWVLDPESLTGTMRRHRAIPNALGSRYNRCPDLLPGCAVPVRTLFE